MSTRKKPTRSWRTNVWGNVVGYESGRRVEEFGASRWDRAEIRAELWARGHSADDAARLAYEPGAERIAFNNER